MNRRWKGLAAVALAWLVRFEQFAAVGLLVTILVTMGLQVVARYIFRSPISWSEEVARLGMIWLTFVASGFVAAQRQHMAVDLFGPPNDSPAATGDQAPGVLSPTAANRCWTAARRLLLASRLVNGLVLVSTLLLLIGGMRFVWRVYPVGSPSVGISMTFWYGAASVGLALIALHTLADLLGIERPAAAEAHESLNTDADHS